jgi:hypothetical protein
MDDREGNVILQMERGNAEFDFLCGLLALYVTRDKDTEWGHHGVRRVNDRSDFVFN